MSPDAPGPSPLRQLAPTRAERIEVTGTDGRPVVGLVATATGPLRGGVLLVPGYTGSKEDFAPLLDPLADHGFDVLAVDLPGQYESPGGDDPARYRPDALAADLVLVAGAMRSRATARSGVQDLHLVGHSYGGLVARAAVLSSPAAFDSLVLLDSGPAAIDGPRRALVDALEPVLAAEGVEAVYEASVRYARADPRWEEPPPELAAFLRTRFLASPVAALRGMGDAIRAEPDRVADLAELTAPAGIGPRPLVVCGADDDAWPPAEQEDMARRLGAPFVTVPAAAHSPAVENPAGLLAVLLEFWAPAAERAPGGRTDPPGR